MIVANTVQLLGFAVRARRQELGLSHSAVTESGGPSGVTLTKIERGEGPAPRPTTLEKLDCALRWREGSAARVLEGYDPQPLDETFPRCSHEGYSSAAEAAYPYDVAEHTRECSDPLDAVSDIAFTLFQGLTTAVKLLQEHGEPDLVVIARELAAQSVGLDGATGALRGATYAFGGGSRAWATPTRANANAMAPSRTWQRALDEWPQRHWDFHWEFEDILPENSSTTIEA